MTIMSFNLPPGNPAGQVTLCQLDRLKVMPLKRGVIFRWWTPRVLYHIPNWTGRHRWEVSFCSPSGPFTSCVRLEGWLVLSKFQFPHLGLMVRLEIIYGWVPGTEAQLSKYKLL